MRDEASIRTATQFMPPPLPRQAPGPETHRSTIPPRSTVQASEFPLIPSKQKAKLFPTHRKPISPIFSLATPTSHNAPPHPWLLFQKNTQNQSETRINRITRKSFKMNNLQKINRKLSRVPCFPLSRPSFPLSSRPASPIARRPAFSSTSFPSPTSSTSSISPASSTYAKVNSLNGDLSLLFLNSIASQSNRGAANT
jgi:hypothetical protein